MTERKCKNCVFWGWGHEIQANCRRHAPTARLSTDFITAKEPLYPQTSAEHFCGDFEQKPLTPQA